MTFLGDSLLKLHLDDVGNNASTIHLFTYQRFTGTLEHIADILAQPRFHRLPTDKAKVINVLYTLDGRKNTIWGLGQSALF